MSREKGCVLFVLFALTLAVTSDAWAQRRRKSKPAGATPAGETSPKSKAASETSSEGGTGFPALDRAEKFYQRADYYMASIEFNKAIEGDAGGDAGAKMRAEFMMGKTLFKLKFFSAALSYFDRIVQKGPAHPHYNETLQWLASLTHQPVDVALVLEKIGKYNRQELEAPQLEAVRDELYFLLGKYNYNKGKFQEAVSLFNLVPPKSAFYPQAKLFEGATYVREYSAKPAVEAFKAVLRASEESQDPKVKPFQDLANLSLARVFYSTGQFEMATKYFDRVSPEAYDWPNSLFEASWANFMLKQAGYSKALGNIHTLRAPFFEYFIKPESVAEALTVKATIYFYNCLFDRAANAIQEFNDWVPQVAEGLTKLLASNTANDQFYEIAVKIRTGKSGLPPAVERAARAVLSDRSLVRRFDAARELSRELTQHEEADAAWKSTAVATTIYSEIGVTRALAVNETGEIARKRVERLVNELRQLITRVIKIEYEILQGEKGELEEDVKAEAETRGSSRVKDISNVRIDDEHEFWPFMGEYWRDELGYYRYKLLNKCARGSAGPEGAPAGGGEQAPVQEGDESSGGAPAAAPAPEAESAPASE
jgi:tetratricopeptide (TPR) repeat protein